MTIEEHPLEPFLPENAKILFLGSFPPPKARWSMEFFYPNWINDFWRIQGVIHFGDCHYFESNQLSDNEPEKQISFRGKCDEEYCKHISPERQDEFLEPSRRSECSNFDKLKISKVAPHRFDKDRIVEFCKSEGLAFFDTARKVCRLKDNADDNFLEIVEGTDVFELLRQMPVCRTIVTTGGKASEELQSYFASRGLEVAVPKVGECVEVIAPKEKDSFELVIPKAGENATAPPIDENSSVAANAPTITWWRMPSTSRAYPMKLEKKAEYYRKVLTVVEHS